MMLLMDSKWRQELDSLFEDWTHARNEARSNKVKLGGPGSHDKMAFEPRFFIFAII